MIHVAFILGIGVLLLVLAAGAHVLNDIRLSVIAVYADMNKRDELSNDQIVYHYATKRLPF
jgi:hypothetical protein